MSSGWIPAAAAFVFATPLLADTASPDFLPDAARPRMQSPAIDEASGIAASRRKDGFLWVINDSGGTTDVHLIGTDGSDRGKVRLTNARNTDWEDLASFTLDGTPYLLVADTGDNDAARKNVTLHILAEQKLPSGGEKLDATSTAAWSIDFTYEGGPRDCEAVAVDVKAGKILLLSKRTKPPELYELPLRPSGKRGVIVAKKIGTTSVEPPSGSIIPYAAQPCALDIAADGSFAAVATYFGVFVFPKKADESWAEAFSRKPHALAPHRLGQVESVAISRDGKSVIVTAEGTKAPLAAYRR